MRFLEQKISWAVVEEYLKKLITKANIGIKIFQTTGLKFSEKNTRKLDDCIAEQAKALHSYFDKLKNAASQGIDIGLSGGYDSRLALACLHKFNTGKLHLHSHATENVHQKDLEIAKQMADYIGVPCHTVPTKKLNNSDNVEDILRKSILYFYGRSSFSIGAGRIR